jgi:hypothetical protein
MVDAQPRRRRRQSADHTAKQFPIWPTTQWGAFLAWSARSPSRGAVGCIDMTSGIAARLGLPGSHWLGRRQTCTPNFSKANPGSLLLQGPVSVIFFDDRRSCASLAPRPALVHILTGQGSESADDVMVAPNRDDGHFWPTANI